MRRVLSQHHVADQLIAIGVRPADVLVVHTSFANAGPVEEGPEGLIGALLSVVGPEGTLVMPSMADVDDEPFDPIATACAGMGVVADTFWRLPEVLRSDSPHAFAAVGPRAEEILAPHPPDFPHGPNSPIGRVHELDGRVLLLGVDHTSNTTIHLAEALAGVRYRRRKHLTLGGPKGQRRMDYGEIDHCCENFAVVDGWLDEARLQIHGTVGHAHARLARSRHVVDTVFPKLMANETAFLHPIGVDDQCDEAWASLSEIPS